MEDEKEPQDDDVEATEDLEVGDDAENVEGGLLPRSNPDAGGHFA
jgi:hypothetical protein